MNIAYFIYEDLNAESGISKKIKQQIYQWELVGHEVNVVSVRTELDKYKRFRISFIPASLKAMVISRSLRQQLFDIDPDIIYMRQILWFPFLCSLLRSHKYVVEINSDALSEYKKQSFIKYLYHMLTSKFLFEKASGVVSVSQELTGIVKQYHKPLAVIANGYSIESHKVGLELSNTCHDSKIRLVFVGSPNQDWHGVDHIASIAQKCPEFEFHIVMKDYFINLPNVICHGALYGSDLHKLYAECDIGIGSLALYRKSMNEASPLKTREYLAHGLPVIFGYEDTDLDCFSVSDGLLKLPNSKDNINCVSDIKAFCKSWKGKRVTSTDVLSKISYKNKENLRLSFFSKILSREA